jgi:hypothetical protein
MWGCPKAILTDRGSAFIGKLMECLTKMLGIHRLRTSSFHAATNSVCERINQEIWKGLRSHGTDQTQWLENLQTVMYGLRATPSVSGTEFSPFRICYGKDMRMPIDTTHEIELPDVSKFQTVSEHVQKMGKRLELLRQIARENTVTAKEKFKAQYDAKAAPRQFELGDKVWVQNAITPPGKCRKLLPKYLGPYFVQEKIGEVTYRLRECETNKILKHPIHVNRLKAFNDDRELLQHANDTRGEPSTGEQVEEGPLATGVPTEPVPQDAQRAPETETWYDVQRLLKVKGTGKGRKYYVLWGDNSKTWEPVHNISDYLIRQFHVKRTSQGTTRKHAPKSVTSAPGG